MPVDDLLEVINRAWAWAMPRPRQVLSVNKFGNVLVATGEGSLCRICPEELSCVQVGRGGSDLDALLDDPEFREDWEMTKLRCFCLKIPSVLGGEYAADNIGTISVREVVGFAGDLGLKIKDLPDGTQVRLDVDA